MQTNIDKILERAMDNKLAAKVGIRPTGEANAAFYEIMASRATDEPPKRADDLLKAAARERRLDSLAAGVVVSDRPENN